MPKALTKPQPSSSVAKMLEPGIGAQIMARQRPIEVPTMLLPVQSSPVPENANQDEFRPIGEVPDVPRQFMLTSRTDRILKRVVSMYTEATGIDLKQSELLRAILITLEHAMPDLTREAESIGALRRPKNDKGKEPEREAMERRIATAFLQGMRSTNVMLE